VKTLTPEERVGLPGWPGGPGGPGILTALKENTLLMIWRMNSLSGEGLQETTTTVTLA